MVWNNSTVLMEDRNVVGINTQVLIPPFCNYVTKKDFVQVAVPVCTVGTDLVCKKTSLGSQNPKILKLVSIMYLRCMITRL